MIKPTMLIFMLCVTSAMAQPPQPAELAPRETAEGVLFQCYAPEATRVYLAGDFNDFAQNVGGRIRDTQYAMTGPDASGIFSKTIKLEPGLYRYKFAIEGIGFTWFIPEYERRRDSDGNAYVVVDGVADQPGRIKSAHAPQVTTNGITFELFAPDADIVYLAGSFNNWANNREGRLQDLRFAMRGPDKFGIWRTTINLSRGRHEYQFVINGRDWIYDPLVPDQTADHHSVLEVK